MSSREVYDELKEHFASYSDVELPGKKGAQGLKYKGKMFAMFWKGHLVLKFSPNRVAELISQNIGEPYDPGTGTPMKDRVLISTSKKSEWIELCKESKAFVEK